MSAVHRKEMRKAERRLVAALKKAKAACGDLEFQAHLSINANNVNAPWVVRSLSMNLSKTVELAQCLALDLPGNIQQVST